jgi:DNA-directed RNA polymerase specialized sigma24 family protein
MADTPRERGPLSAGPDSFATTHWSVVLAAGRRGSPQSEAALAALCQAYWFPLYAYVRRVGHSVNDAQDLTQDFFARLLEKQYLATADPQRGKFRCFLLTSLKHFLANAGDRAKARKRGGGVRHLSLNLECGESRVQLEPSHDLTPEWLFERHWVLTLLHLVMGRLQAEYESSGKAEQFERLKGALTGSGERLPYAVLAAELGISEEAARQAASRLRKRYRELLREEVAQTLAETGDVDEEIRNLFAAFGR